MVAVVYDRCILWLTKAPLANSGLHLLPIKAEEAEPKRKLLQALMLGRIGFHRAEGGCKMRWHRVSDYFIHRDRTTSKRLWTILHVYLIL